MFPVLDGTNNEICALIRHPRGGTHVLKFPVCSTHYGGWFLFGSWIHQERSDHPKDDVLLYKNTEYNLGVSL